MRRLMIALLLLSSTPALALQIVELSWRQASELQSALQAQLLPDERLSALDNKLIIDANPAREQQLAALARQLDVRPLSLRLEVSQSGSSVQSQSGVQLQGNISIGRIIPGSAGNGVSLSAQQDSRSQSGQSLQSLTLLDGRSGFIQLVQSRPLSWLLLTPQGNIVRGSSWQEAVSGFYALPRLQGERVVIELAVSQQAFAGKQREGSQLSTTVAGRLGEWIEVGGIVRDQQGQNSLLLGSGQQLLSKQQSVRIRVQALP
ncbi:hypothetical protein EAY64_18815 [Aquitalea palustris]|uniref:Uncharacterized protein n=1 Tax=Aquitalea palustris TaxID=2480983 RepID=A0A454JDJ2_9NEIS|nr:hypothetical protein [Aquitalea palustris]RMC91684.1 hypothetical protein EAY64_18815 [Aquitalea palustris]